METKTYSEVYLDNGHKIEIDDDPAELIEKFTDKNGKIRDEFIEMGISYINPRHVSLIVYGEKRQASGAVPKPAGW